MGRGRIETVLPPVIGHRGAAACAPENTLAGFRKAKALGCRWVEFDVRLTADGEPILLHDNRLDRTTNGRGRVSGLSLAAVRRHDAGNWFHPTFAGERVPRLEEALALLAELDLGANVELKAARGKEAATGALVADLLARTWPADPAHLLISSFQRGALAAARDRAPHIARGVLFQRIPKNWRGVADGLGCATIHADQRRLRPAVLSEIRRAGYPLLAYTVNEPERAKTLFEWGVTSVFSDVPQRLHEAAARDGFLRPVPDPAPANGTRQESVW
ncbi:MAG TPA: glycerophosphodiester phosphodiesterase [Stellaceae bacterium]|nr:glycerophosphodiester phosphodiesterase [Stellaceae bacterium]